MKLKSIQHSLSVIQFGYALIQTCISSNADIWHLPINFANYTQRAKPYDIMIAEMTDSSADVHDPHIVNLSSTIRS